MKAKLLLIFVLAFFYTNFSYCQIKEYSCGFASADESSTNQTIISGSADGDSSCAMILGAIPFNKTDSLINSVYLLFQAVLSGRPNSICLIRDDGVSTGYKYAAAGRRNFEDGSNKRTLTYRPNELTTELMNTENGWALKAILFHEMGHHQNGDNFTLVDKQIAEEWADIFAGHWLSIFGAPLQSVRSVYNQFTDSVGGNGYLSRSKRIQIVQDAWMKAKHSDNSIILSLARAVSLFNNPLSNNNTFSGDTKESVTKMIEGNVKKNFLNKLTIVNRLEKLELHTSGIFSDNFLIDKNFLYFKTLGKLFAIGRVAPSDLPEYSLMIYDKYFNYIYVDKQGALSVVNLKFKDQQMGTFHVGDLLK